MNKDIDKDTDIIDLIDSSNTYRYISMIAYFLISSITTIIFAFTSRLSIITIIISNIVQSMLILSYLNSIRNLSKGKFSEDDIYIEPFYIFWGKDYNIYYKKIINNNLDFIRKNKNILHFYTIKNGFMGLSMYSFIFISVNIILIALIFSTGRYSNELFPLNSITLMPLMLIVYIKTMNVLGSLEKIKVSKEVENDIINSEGKSILSLGGYYYGSDDISEINLLKNRIKLSLKETAKSITILKKNKRNEEVRMIRNIINKLLKPIERFKQIDDKGNEYYNLDYNIVNDVVNMLNTTNSSLSVCIKDTEKDNIETIKKVEKEVDDFLEGTNSIIDKLLLNDISRLKDRIEVEMKVYGR